MTPHQKPLQNPEPEQSTRDQNQRDQTTRFTYLGVALFLILFFVSAWIFFLKRKGNRQLAKQKLEIEEKNAELAQKNHEITSLRNEIDAHENIVYQQKELIEMFKEFDIKDKD